eukprot:6788290-Ditylum_brightwellii.AAC.1
MKIGNRINQQKGQESIEQLQVIKMEELINYVNQSTAAEMKKTMEEHNKKIAAVEPSVTDFKTLVQQDMEQMKKELPE